MRFNRFIFCATAAIALLASCKEKEDPTSGEASITLKSESSITLTKETQSVDIEFLTNREWTASAKGAESWLNIAPASGSASSDVQKVTVTVTPNDSYDRSATITISIGVTNKKVTINQSGSSAAPDGSKGTGTEADPFNAAAANEKCEEIGATASTEEYYVKGIISFIKEISTDYGNATFYISDDGSTTLDQFYVFHAYSFDGVKFVSKNQLKVGDEVVVKGKLVNYYGNTPEMANGQLVSVNGGQDVSYLSVDEPNEVSSEAGELTLNVSSNQSWTASTEATWLTVSPASGENNGTVVLKYEANSGDARSAEVIFEGNKGSKKTVTLNQVAAGEEAFTVITWKKKELVAEWGEDKQLYQAPEITLIKSGYTIVLRANGGSNNPYGNDDAFRAYAKNTIEISCETEMTEIEFELNSSGAKRYAKITPDCGEVGAQAEGDEKVTWTGSSKKVIFTVGEKSDYGTEAGKAGQFHFKALRIK